MAETYVNTASDKIHIQAQENVLSMVGATCLLMHGFAHITEQGGFKKINSSPKRHSCKPANKTGNLTDIGKSMPAFCGPHITVIEISAKTMDHQILLEACNDSVLLPR